VTATDRLVSRQPLEVVERGSVWVVGEFDRGAHDGDRLSTHTTQIDALRSAKTVMERQRRPCVLRWSSPRSVGEIYWNPLFERLDVRFDELLDSWSVTPEAGTFALATVESRDRACDVGKDLQREYDFKRLRAYDAADQGHEERDHRFLRHDITASGVRFDAGSVSEPDEQAETAADGTSGTAEQASQTTTVGPATPGQLGASVDDVTQVEFIDTDGVLNRYAAPWVDGTTAEILALSRKYADEGAAREAFTSRLDRWRGVAGTAHVAPIRESGTDPVPWVAYQATDGTVETLETDLSVDARLSILGQVVDALEAASGGPLCGPTPQSVHVETVSDGWRATVSTWGTEWAVRRAVGATQDGPYTAPEMLDGRLTATSVVYRTAALAHRLLCGRPPVDAPAADSTVAGVDAAVRPVLERGLDPNPETRHETPRAFYRALRDNA
jgi:hypothetical protein